MTGGEFSGVDFDLLADYVGGALDGSPREAVVAGLITDDPSWRAAHDELVSAMVPVHAQLGVLAATSEPMPADVAERLEAALTAGSGPVASARHLAAVPETTAGGSAPGTGHAAAGRRRRWRPRAGALAAAAAVVGFAAIGINQFATSAYNATGASDVPAAGARPAVEGAPIAPPGANQGADSGRGTAVDKARGAATRRIVASGTVYERATVASTAVGLARKAGDLAAAPGAGPDAAPGTDQQLPLSAGGTGDLRRLNNAAALDACLDAIGAAHGSPVAAVDVIDFATFEGAPAVVLVFDDAADAEWVWVSGPGCGTAESGAHTRYQTRVG